MADASSEANSNIRELKYTVIRSVPYLNKLLRLIKKYLKKGVDRFSVIKSYRNLTKYKSGISRTTLLSVKDLEVLKKQAKNWQIQYSIIKVDAKNKKKDVGFFKMLKERFDKKTIEEPKYQVVYRTADAEVMLSLIHI